MRLFGLLIAGLAVSACGPSRTCRTPAAPPSYATDVKPIASVKCENCHSTKVKGVDRRGAPDDLNYETFAKMKDNAEQAALAVEKDLMPLKNMGQPDLSAAEKDTFLQWVYCGTAP